MIDTIACKIASRIKQSSPEQTSSVEVMQYALIIYMNAVLILLESVAIGWMTGRLLDTLICFAAFTGLRFFSGGKHLRSTLLCNVVSTAIFSIIPHVPITSMPFIMVMNACSLLIMALFAPNVDSETDINRRYYPLLKLISLTIVSMNFVFQSATIGLCFLVQSITIIPWWERR